MVIFSVRIMRCILLSSKYRKRYRQIKLSLTVPALAQKSFYLLWISSFWDVIIVLIVLTKPTFETHCHGKLFTCCISDLQMHASPLTVFIITFVIHLVSCMQQTNEPISCRLWCNGSKNFFFYLRHAFC